ncbi:MarR family winged helix-turn-helix transcriptional regulator [Bradyrhizobium sp. USDA 4452]
MIYRNHHRGEPTQVSDRTLAEALMRKVGGKSALNNGVIMRMGDSLFMRARYVSRSVTELFDKPLRPFGISSAQFVLLSMIDQAGSITRAEIARLQHLERSTLTRNLKLILCEGWVEEVRDNADGRSRPIALTNAGKDLLFSAQSAWLAAQDEAKALLGNDGTMALISIADRITHPIEGSSEPPSSALVSSAD